MGLAALSDPGIARTWGQDSAPSLKQSASAAGLFFGSPLFSQDLKRPQVLELYAQQCSLVVAAVYMNRVQPEPDRFDFSVADQVRDFAKGHGMKLRGHPLVYGKVTPDWVQALNRGQARDALERHVKTVAGRYRGQMYSWDVVNEAIQPKPRGMYHEWPWFKLLGPEYIEIAFHVAAAADPNALLAYNDFGLEADGEEHERKRDAVFRMLHGLRKRNVPVGALGIQSHIGPQFEGKKLPQFLQRVREQLGLKIIVSELDVRDWKLPGDIASRDAGVARAYRTYLDTVLPNPALVAVITWGLYDGDTWLSRTSPREDGLPVRALPFDADLRPKPAMAAMIESFARRRV